MANTPLTESGSNSPVPFEWKALWRKTEVRVNGLFISPLPKSTEVQQRPDNGQDSPRPEDATAAHNIMSSITPSVLFAMFAAACLHALQWLCGWGWGSFWGVMSSVVLLSLGMSAVIGDNKGPGVASARFGACVGAAMGLTYGLFSGGLLAGVLFGGSVGAWASWFAASIGLTTSYSRFGIVAAALAVCHILGMLSPSTVAVSFGANSSQKRESPYQLGFRSGMEAAESTANLIRLNKERGIASNIPGLLVEASEFAERLKEAWDVTKASYDRDANHVGETITRLDGSTWTVTAEYVKIKHDAAEEAKGRYEGYLSIVKPLLW